MPTPRPDQSLANRLDTQLQRVAEAKAKADLEAHQAALEALVPTPPAPPAEVPQNPPSNPQP